jgi:uncharacterized protein YbaR (Trm112 family)
MRLETIQKLCCPFDKSDLELTIAVKDLNENVQEGFLTCSTCKRIYPFVKGIPIMSPDEYREPAMEQPLLERMQQQLVGKSVENFRLISNQ